MEPKPKKKFHSASRERKFVHEYLIDLNGTKAAIRAGYSPGGAQNMASRLLDRPRVRDRIAKKMAERSAVVDIKANDVLREALLLMRSDIRDFEIDAEGKLGVVDGVDDSVGRAVSQIKQHYTYGKDGEVVARQTTIKLWPKDSALTLVARHLGMLIDKHEMTGKDGQPIQIEDARATIDGTIDRLAAAINTKRNNSEPK